MTPPWSKGAGAPLIPSAIAGPARSAAPAASAMESAFRRVAMVMIRPFLWLVAALMGSGAVQVCGRDRPKVTVRAAISTAPLMKSWR